MLKYSSNKRLKKNPLVNYTNNKYKFFRDGKFLII